MVYSLKYYPNVSYHQIISNGRYITEFSNWKKLLMGLSWIIKKKL